MAGSRVFFGVLVAALISCVQGSSFLKPIKDKRVTRALVQQTLMTALSMDESKLSKVKEYMQPIFAALPKTVDGSLEKTTVHYALHRYFVQRHSWYVKGLLHTEDEAATTSVSTILREKAPSHIQGLLEEHYHGHGWQLHELAVYASALSELIRIEALTDLNAVYRMLTPELEETGGFAELAELTVLDGYLLQYVLAENNNFSTFEDMKKEVETTWPGWHDFQMWAHDLHRDLKFASCSRHNPFKQETWQSSIADTVQELGHAYGDFQIHECNSLKDFLKTMEVEGSGRVPLADFYKVGMSDEWRFWESPAYLRHLGSLDESRPGAPMVIIPNFVAGHNNCVASSSFVEVCCVNQCDRIISQLEQQLAAPAASATHIAELVSKIPSESVEAPRNLSVSLLSRLDEIAGQHNGQVPVHGRLFSQWMHHAYPLDCPYPEVEVNQQLTVDEFEALGEVSMLSEDRQRQAISKLVKDQKVHTGESVELPWVSYEKLVDPKWEAHKSGSGVFRKVMVVVALLSFAVPLTKVSKVATARKDQHHLV